MAACTADLSWAMPLANEAMRLPPRFNNPGFKLGRGLVSYHGLEAVDEHTSIGQYWNSFFDGSDRDGLAFSQVISFCRHKLRQCPGGWDFPQLWIADLLGATTRLAHSVTTRSEPSKPCRLRRRQSSRPLRQPSAHCASRNGR